MISFIVGLIIGGCVAALAFTLCEPKDEIQESSTEDKCCYFCNGASECLHTCKNNPNDCGKKIEI
jgi:hypothetical protein